MTQLRSNKNENFIPTFFSDIFNDAKFYGRNWLEKEFGNTLPSVNIRENEKNFTLEFAAPGFKKENFNISIDKNVLSVIAEKEEEKNDESKTFTRREFSFNSFSRSFSLPENADEGKIDAKYENGILNITIPKKELSANPLKKLITVA